MKRIISSIIFSSLVLCSFAGGLLTNTNQHAAFIRNPARGASLGLDAIYYNPAGTAFFQDGWAFSFNYQMINQNRDVLSTFAPYETHYGVDQVKYKGDVFVPVLPTIFASYKTGKLTFSGFFGVPGGGGKVDFENGLPSFSAPVIAQMASLGISNYDLTSSFVSTQYVFALQLGAAYEITSNLSAYLGVRGNYASNTYEGDLNVTIPDGHPAQGVIGRNPVRMKLDSNQKGIGFAPIVGVNYKLCDNINLAAKYEFKSIINLKNNTKENFNSAAPGNILLPQFADGNKLRSDQPALLTLGASWQICPMIQIMGGWNYYFDKDAKMESLLAPGSYNQRKLSHNTFEYLFGAEVQVTEKLLLSSGIQITKYGENDEYVTDLTFVSDAFTVGVGGKYNITKKLDINAGYFYTNYSHYTKYSEKYNGTRDSGSSMYSRDSRVFSVGVDYRF